MKKFFALTMACAMLTGVLSGCGSTAVVHVSDADLLAADTGSTTEETTTESTESTTEETTTETTTDTETAAGAVKTGLAVQGSLSSSKPAADGEDGLAQADINIAAVTVNGDGVIESCVIDAVQIKIH